MSLRRLARTDAFVAGCAFRLACILACTLGPAQVEAQTPAPATPMATPTAPAATPAPAQDFSNVTIKTTDLGHGLYMLEGAGGNITAAVGRDGVILVDGQFAPLHDKIKAAIGALTKEPIKYVINTHFHGDHTGGNAGFAKDGAVIVAQQNVRTRLAAGTVNGLNGAKTPPAPAQALPTDTFRGRSTIRVQGLRARLRHIANAHTDGDTYVHFRRAGVLATGDIVTLGRYPNIDFANGGNIKGMIEGVDTYLRIGAEGLKIVPGHGPLATKAMLRDYRTMLVESRERMEKLIKEGKSEDEAIAARPFTDFDAKLRADDQASRNWIRVVYNSLKPKSG